MDTMTNDDPVTMEAKGRKQAKLGKCADLLISQCNNGKTAIWIDSLITKY